MKGERETLDGAVVIRRIVSTMLKEFPLNFWEAIHCTCRDLTTGSLNGAILLLAIPMVPGVLCPRQLP